MISTKNETMATMFKRAFPDIAADLGDADLNELLDGASLVEVAPGRKLMRDRMPVEALYFVLEGSLRAYLEEGGKALDLDPVAAGEWLGEVSILSGEGTATATVESVTACKLISIHRITFEKLITENQGIARVLLERLIHLMAKRLRSN